MLREQTAAKPERMERALAGLRKYQEASRTAPPPQRPAIAEYQGATLRDYGGSGAPVLFIPSLINPPNILDLSENRSLLRWLAGRGCHVLLIDWGWPSESRRGLDVTGHVEQIALPMIRELGGRIDLVGYCLGGTMAIAASCLVETRSLATIAAPWQFGNYPADTREALARLWADSRDSVRQLGLLPMEVLQSAFWNLDPERTISKFEAFADMPDEKAEAFVALEDWANDGPPISGAAAREMFEDFFGSDLPGSGGWEVGGQRVEPAGSETSLLQIVSTVDRIVPQETAIQGKRRLALNQGHVGMVIGTGARQGLWAALADWLGCPGE